MIENLYEDNQRIFSVNLLQWISLLPLQIAVEEENEKRSHETIFANMMNVLLLRMST